MNIFKKGAWTCLLISFLAVTTVTFLATEIRCAPTSVQASAPKSDYENTPIHLERISLIDCYGRREEGWQIVRYDRPASAGSDKPHPWDAYDSLYSPDLRSLLNSLPKGTRIGLEVSPAAPVYGRFQADPDERELKDFSDYCTAHGLRYFMMPIS